MTPVDYSELGRIGIIGGTGNIGAFITGAAAENGVVITSRSEPSVELPEGVEWAPKPCWK